MVKSAGAVRLDITGQPRKGGLSELSEGLLQYTPNIDFKKGSDFFEFAIYSQNNNLLKRDSIVIVVESDSTKLPCGLYPQNDSVTYVTGPTLINVLLNDALCGDSTQIGVSIYRPNSSFPPHTGTAVMQGTNILYTPGNSFTGNDKVVYKVYSLTDTTKYGIGTVYISRMPVCNFAVNTDSYVFRGDTLTSSSVHLNVFNNDQLCGTPVGSYAFTMLRDGDVGNAVYQNAGGVADFVYSFSDTITRDFTDSLTYRLCREAQCKTAKVYIQVNNN
jgi:hypothetical protein